MLLFETKIKSHTLAWKHYFTKGLLTFTIIAMQSNRYFAECSPKNESEILSTHINLESIAARVCRVLHRDGEGRQLMSMVLSTWTSSSRLLLLNYFWWPMIILLIISLQMKVIISLASQKMKIDCLNLQKFCKNMIKLKLKLEKPTQVLLKLLLSPRDTRLTICFFWFIFNFY